MPKITQEERVVAQRHPILFPVIIVLIIMVVAISILGYFLYQTVGENTRLKQNYKETNQNINNNDNNQDQQLQNNPEGL